MSPLAFKKDASDFFSARTDPETPCTVQNQHKPDRLENRTPNYLTPHFITVRDVHTNAERSATSVTARLRF